MDPPHLPLRPPAVTENQAMSRAQQTIGATQGSPSSTLTRPTPDDLKRDPSTTPTPSPRFGVGLSFSELARQAEAERVRIQEYAARKTAENNPPRPHQGLRQEAITKIRAATNRRLDEQAYAAHMVKMENSARAKVEQINRVQADVMGAAPEMAEPTKEVVEAANILMQMQKNHIAGLEYLIGEQKKRVAEQQAASQMQEAAAGPMLARQRYEAQYEQERQERERARNAGQWRLQQAMQWRNQQ